MSDKIDIAAFKEMLQQYAEDRDWVQFHNPKNLAMALSVEASELVEIFQWLTLEQASRVDQDESKWEAIHDEIADIFVYLVRMCGVLGISLKEAVDKKMKKNAAKYPIEKAKGNAKKYTEF